MEDLIKKCYDKINYDQHEECSSSLGDDCLECSYNMYWGGNDVDYQCENKRLIYITRYFPAHSSEIYNALYGLFLTFHDEIKDKNKLVFASFGGGPGIDTYSFHRLLNSCSEEIECKSILAFRIEACEEWTELAKEVMFINSPEDFERKYYRRIADVTSDDIRISEKFDIAVLSYIVSELNDNGVDKLIENILKNKSKQSYILINDRSEDDVIKKINKIMTSVTVGGYSQCQFNNEHCGFSFPDDIYSDMSPKVYRKSVYFTGKLK
ncbi:hypothetical protein [Pectobacterium versatile]|uniref:Uncharacterized protein n=1 Tax=Pectobacterium versatile TaxID=2488639 RepID=A0ABU8K5M5_9GAMM|nr:hypothetical protein [Yersinia enterocolitica]HDY4931707.1 hypothetical protein [Yersinia enterocolitica]HEB9656719.1 hypothetical protein [Yersinia enterocolitica]HEC1635225.1 hypothetical protein [Yersinia enterocolitica]HED0389637.1 hypothetical protein [Yersinia enterocolitica]